MIGFAFPWTMTKMAGELEITLTDRDRTLGATAAVSQSPQAHLKGPEPALRV
jgi:hypothetical protein